MHKPQFSVCKVSFVLTNSFNFCFRHLFIPSYFRPLIQQQRKFFNALMIGLLFADNTFSADRDLRHLRHSHWAQPPIFRIEAAYLKANINAIG